MNLPTIDITTPNEISVKLDFITNKGKNDGDLDAVRRKVHQTRLG